MKRWLCCMGVCLLLLGGCSRRPNRVTLAGRVVGHDGKPMRSALVLVYGMGVKERAAIDSYGGFSLALQQPGVYYVMLIGVHHRTLLLWRAGWGLRRCAPRARAPATGR